MNTVGGYSCRCPVAYKGKHCDEGKWKLLRANSIQSGLDLVFCNPKGGREGGREGRGELLR